MVLISEVHSSVTFVWERADLIFGLLCKSLHQSLSSKRAAQLLSSPLKAWVRSWKKVEGQLLCALVQKVNLLNIIRAKELEYHVIGQRNWVLLWVLLSCVVNVHGSLTNRPGMLIQQGSCGSGDLLSCGVQIQWTWLRISGDRLGLEWESAEFYFAKLPVSYFLNLSVSLCLLL